MQTKLIVDGMSCSHCENTVKKAVLAMDGVTEVAVDLTAKTVVVFHDETVGINRIRAEIEEQGYDIVG